MICLDNTDTLEGGASVDAVVDYTVHGLVGSTFTKLAAGQLSNADPSVLYTAGAAVSVVSATFVNTNAAAVTINLYLDPANGGNPRRMIPEDLSLGIGYSMHFDGQRCTVLDTTGAVQTIVPGATMNDDTNVSANGWVLDEDNMASDDATKLSTQQAIKAYVDAKGYKDRGDPAAVDFARGVLTLDSTWRDLDLSGIVPVGAVAVEITVQAANNVVGKLISFRKNGNTNTRVTLSQKTQVATKQIYISGKVACDGDRIIEYFGTANDGDWTAAQITICGWYM